MNDQITKSLLCPEQKHDMMATTVVISQEDAKKLADLHLALTQLYRRMAGLTPVPTAAHQRKLVAECNK